MTSEVSIFEVSLALYKFKQKCFPLRRKTLFSRPKPRKCLCLYVDDTGVKFSHELRVKIIFEAQPRKIFEYTNPSDVAHQFKDILIQGSFPKHLTGSNTVAGACYFFKFSNENEAKDFLATALRFRSKNI